MGTAAIASAHNSFPLDAFPVGTIGGGISTVVCFIFLFDKCRLTNRDHDIVNVCFQFLVYLLQSILQQTLKCFEKEQMMEWREAGRANKKQQQCPRTTKRRRLPQVQSIAVSALLLAKLRENYDERKKMCGCVCLTSMAQLKNKKVIYQSRLQEIKKRISRRPFCGTAERIRGTGNLMQILDLVVLCFTSVEKRDTREQAVG